MGAESAFWYALKKHLNSEGGYDLVKKVMSKDGHLMGGDTYPYYLRDRAWRYCIYDDLYQLRLVNVAYNNGDIVRLPIHPLKGDNSVILTNP